jgi:MoaA/NifB/PqqE/SkfB family radical SAM enzyme
MRVLDKIYLEITNQCNLACAFCPPHRRASRSLSREEFTLIVSRLRGRARSLYFHLKGEPLLHPDLGAFIPIAAAAGLPVSLTSNGTLLESRLNDLAGQAGLARLNLSLHSLGDAGDALFPLLAAIDALVAANRRVRPDFLVSGRLWTRDRVGETAGTLAALERFYGLPAGELSRRIAGKNGCVVHPGFALHLAETFEWPSLDAPDYGETGFCRGLRDQAGILADGTVVPCCLDGGGVIALGNILETDWEAILASPRARRLYDGFSERRVVEPLCRRCGYRCRFNPA